MERSRFCASLIPQNQPYYEHSALLTPNSADCQSFMCKQVAKMKDAGVAYSTLTFDGAGIAVVEADRMKLVSRVMVCNMHADE